MFPDAYSKFAQRDHDNDQDTYTAVTDKATELGLWDDVLFGTLDTERTISLIVSLEARLKEAQANAERWASLYNSRASKAWGDRKEWGVQRLHHDLAFGNDEADPLKDAA